MWASLYLYGALVLPLSVDGHVLDTKTYVSGHDKASESCISCRYTKSFWCSNVEEVAPLGKLQI